MLSSSSVVPPGNCGIHGYHGRSACPNCSTSTLPFTPLAQSPPPGPASVSPAEPREGGEEVAGVTVGRPKETRVSGHSGRAAGTGGTEPRAPATDPVVSPADTIRRVLGELGVLRYGRYERPQVHDGFAAVDEWEAVGERDRRQIARLTEALREADEQLDRAPKMALPNLVELFKQRVLKARSIIAAVLADEEDAANG